MILHSTKKFQSKTMSKQMKTTTILFVSIDIILMASNSSNFYVLKYNIKHALEESEHSSTQSLTAEERKTLRQAQKECRMIDYFFYSYSTVDLLTSIYTLRKFYAHNSHTYIRMLQKSVLFLAIRIVLVYELTNHLSVKHLESRALPILAK